MQEPQQIPIKVAVPATGRTIVLPEAVGLILQSFLNEVAVPMTAQGKMQVGFAQQQLDAALAALNPAVNEPPEPAVND